ncbi:hypothetical protein [Halorientalis persicus]|nr:hypothetical protein [Halorientalis persicus]
MTDDELAEASEQIQDLREEVRDDLAADLGGDPADYRANKRFDDEGERSGEAVPDGGE